MIIWLVHFDMEEAPYVGPNGHILQGSSYFFIPPRGNAQRLMVKCA
jgi:hypothetical protein